MHRANYVGIGAFLLEQKLDDRPVDNLLIGNFLLVVETADFQDAGHVLALEPRIHLAEHHKLEHLLKVVQVLVVAVETLLVQGD